MIRILNVVDSLKLGSGIMGVIMNYYRALDRSEVQFDFLYFLDTERNHSNEIKDLGGFIYKLPMLSISSVYSFHKNIYSFMKHLDYEYKIIHLHEVLLNAPVFFNAKRLNIPIRIIHSHNSVGAETKLKKIRNKILTMPLKKISTDFFACSDSAGLFLYGERYMRSKKIKILNNAVDLDTYEFNPFVRDEIRKKYNIRDSHVIGHVGSFCIQKNHDFLIDIFNEYLKLEPQAVLMLIGDGKLKVDIHRKVQNLGIDKNVIFVGKVSNVKDYLNAIDILVMPSLFEGLPVVGVEAQANSLPCVFSDEITKSVVLLPSTELLSLKSSPKEWACLIDKKIRNKEHLTIRRQCVKKELTQKGFSIKEEAKKLQDYYRKRISDL